MRIGPDTVLIVTSTGRDGLASTITETAVWADHCWLQPFHSVETISVITDIDVDRFVLFAPPGTVLSSTGRVVSGATTFTVVNGLVVPDAGVSYEVEGDPMPWYDRRGVFHHIECRLKRMPA